MDARAVQDDTLYRALDLLLEHKEALFAHLHERWRDLFGVRYEVLLNDLTSTYFECDVPAAPGDPRRFGYSRDKRGDCVQVVIALVVTPEGLPLAYEMLPGNTADKTTLRAMLATIGRRYGEAERIWVMDRGVATEDILAELRQATVRYLVGTTKGRLTRYEAALAERPWQQDLFVAFLAYCLMTTLRQQLRGHAVGLRPRLVLEKLATIQMLDVCVPTTDGRERVLTRHTEPSNDVALLLEHLNLDLPPQPPPKIRYPAATPPV